MVEGGREVRVVIKRQREKKAGKYYKYHKT